MKLFLIDGHALVFKMYYAFLGRPMINSKGVDTSILFGFTKYLLELIEREKPTHIAVSFDPPGGTFRNELYPEYKANRVETPQLVIDALEPLTRIVKALDIPVLMIKGFEADDVIGSMAKRSAAQGFDVYMVTPDKDYGQLVEPHIWQYRPAKAGGENEVLGVAEICEKWKISNPSQVIDILTLCGDSSDNVPGVQGVGPVGAAKLLAKYGTVENIYAHVNELTPRQKGLFEAARDHIGLSKQLVTIKTDIPLQTTADDMVYDSALPPELTAIFDEFEFFSLKKKIQSLPPSLRNTQLVEEKTAFELKYTEVAPSQLKGEKIALSLHDGMLYAATADRAAKGTPQEFRALLEDPAVTKAGEDVKSLYKGLSAAGITLQGRQEDVTLMHYLLNPERSHRLEALVLSYLGVDLESGGPEQTGSLFDDVPEEDGPDRMLRTVAVWHLAGRLRSEMDSAEGISKLYDKIEEPLVGVLARMELTGVKGDVDSLR